MEIQTAAGKVYEGRINENDPGFTHRVYANGSEMDPTRNIEGEYSQGYCWGYGGQGPHALACHLLYDLLGDAWLARRLHHGFCSTLVAALPMKEPFILSEIQIRAMLPDEPAMALLRKLSEANRAFKAWESKCAQWEQAYERDPVTDPNPAWLDDCNALFEAIDVAETELSRSLTADSPYCY